MKKNFFQFTKTNEEIPKLKEDIFKIDKNIRFVTLIDSKGNLLQNQHRVGVNSVLTRKESQYSIKQITRFWNDNKDLLKKFGQVKYAVIEYSKIKRIVISFSDKEILYITTSPDADHKKIISKIFTLYVK